MSESKKEIFLTDYQTPNYWISQTNLEIDMSKFPATVTSTLTLEQNKDHNKSNLMLNGLDLTLKSIYLNNEELDKTKYSIKDGNLHLSDLPEKAELKTVVEISPDKNFTGEGLYVSGDIYCTQCEAEGFRRITYYLDRPDVMSSFRTKLIAKKDQFPYLLSNGDKVESGDLEDGLHFASWVDPHK